MILSIKTIITNSSLPNFESEILLAFLLHKRREFIITHPERKININNYKKFKRLEKKRLAGYSIAHLVGEKEFFGLIFKVNKHTLIPRPLTELIVEEVITNPISPNTTIIDVGTGSGAIIISLAKELKKINYSLFKKINFIAIDISKPALKIAKENAKLHRLNNQINFYQGNLTEPIKPLDLSSQKLMITANLPYLTPQQTKTLPTIQKEPKIALNGGSGGLILYQKLFKQLDKIKYKELTCICEINPNQKKGMTNLIKKHFESAKFKFKKDLMKKDRFVIIKN